MIFVWGDWDKLGRWEYSLVVTAAGVQICAEWVPYAQRGPAA